ncbi:hypothetical protein RCL1_005803 [Eukaryota sp. TZLM3-RCL]
MGLFDSVLGSLSNLVASTNVSVPYFPDVPAADETLLNTLNNCSDIVFIHGFQARLDDISDNNESLARIKICTNESLPNEHSTFCQLPIKLYRDSYTHYPTPIHSKNVFIIDYSCTLAFEDIVQEIYTFCILRNLSSAAFVAHSCGGLVLAGLALKYQQSGLKFNPSQYIAIDSPFFGLNKVLDTILFDGLPESVENSVYINIIKDRVTSMYGSFLKVLGNSELLGALRSSFDAVHNSKRIAPYYNCGPSCNCECAFLNKYREGCVVWKFSSVLCPSFSQRLHSHMNMFDSPILKCFVPLTSESLFTKVVASVGSSLLMSKVDEFYNQITSRLRQG